MAKRRTPELVELQENFRLYTVYDERRDRMRPCWFAEVLGEEACEGRIEAAHWISRQRIGNDPQTRKAA